MVCFISSPSPVPVLVSPTFFLFLIFESSSVICLLLHRYFRHHRSHGTLTNIQRISLPLYFTHCLIMSEKANTQSPSLPPTELLQQSQGHKDNSDSSTSSSQRSNGNTTPDATANANNNKNIGNFNANFFKNGPNVLNSDSTNGNNENTIDNSPDAIGTTNASNSKPPKDGLAKLDDDASKQPKKKGKAGRPRIHHDNQGSVSGSRTNPDGINVSVNEVIPKVWVICNFGVPVMAQIAIEALKKGDKVVLGCCPGGEDESKLLKRADRLWQRYPDRCIVVELDIK